MSEVATGTGASGSALVVVVVLEAEDFWACPSEEKAGAPSREEGPVKLALRGCAASAGVALSAHTAMPIASVRIKTIVRGYRRPVPACADLGEMLQHQRS